MQDDIDQNLKSPEIKFRQIKSPIMDSNQIH